MADIDLSGAPRRARRYVSVDLGDRVVKVPTLDTLPYVVAKRAKSACGPDADSYDMVVELLRLYIGDVVDVLTSDEFNAIVTAISAPAEGHEAQQPGE